MSDWDDNEDVEGTDLVKNLRKQLKALSTAKTELESELGTLRPQVRKSNVSSVLNKLGVNSKIAALVPESVEPTEAALKTWLADYGDVFGAVEVAAVEPEVKPVVQAGQQAAVVDQGTQLSWSKIQSPEASAGTTVPDIEQQQQAQLAAAAAKSGGNYETFIALLRGEALL